MTCDVDTKSEHIFSLIKKMNSDNYEIETIRQEIVKNHLEVTALIQVEIKPVWILFYWWPIFVSNLYFRVSKYSKNYYKFDYKNIKISLIIVVWKQFC